MGNEVISLKRKLFSKIKKIKENDIISISLIGSFRYIKNLERINDVDIIILIKNLTLKSFKLIKKEFERLAKELETKKIKYVVEDKIGPIKPNPIKNKKVIQLHLLIYDINSWKKKKWKTSLLDWTNFSKVLVGTPLKKVKEIKRFSKKDLIFDLKHTLNNLKNNTAYSAVYYEKSGKIRIKYKALKLTKKEAMENICYNIIIGFQNYVRFFQPTTTNDKIILLKKAKKMLPKEYEIILKKTFMIKEKIRRDKKIVKKEIVQLKKEGINFIKHLAKNI